jgi:DNA-directed RNA polymerase subunit RPC12/RpoP
MSETMNSDKCPSCGGTVVPDESGKLICKYCGSIYTYEQLSSDYEDSINRDYDEYTCNNCGAEIVTDSLNIMSRCAYCGCTSVMKNRISGKYRPDFIIPFKLTEIDAKNILQNTVKGKNFVKKSFRQELEIKDISPLFVPFWLYDCEVIGNGKYLLQNRKDTNKIKFTERYEKIPVDASMRLDDNYMDVLEPFNYSDLKPFNKAYMIGKLAERYDTSAKIMQKRADVKVEKSAKTSLAIHLESHAVLSATNTIQNATNAIANKITNSIDHGAFANNINFQNDSNSLDIAAAIDRIKKFKADIKAKKYYYALFPVYLIRCEYRRKNYLFVVNGQTGKIAGKFEFSMANYILQNFIGISIGALMFSAIAFLVIHKQLKSLLNISYLLVFLIIFAASMLFISVLEIKFNAKFSLDWTKEYLGKKPIIANANHYRVKGSFKRIK